MEGRAAVRAGKRERDRPQGSSVRLLVVRCGRYLLGFPSGLLRGVVAPGEIVPLGWTDLEGLLWRDGALIPAARLGPRLGLPAPKGRTVEHGVLVRTEEGIVCVLVDEALDLIEVPEGSILALPPLVRKVVPLDGLESVAMVGGLLLVADPVRLLGVGSAAELMAAAGRIANPTAAAGSPE